MGFKSSPSGNPRHGWPLFYTFLIVDLCFIFSWVRIRTSLSGLLTPTLVWLYNRLFGVFSRYFVFIILFFLFRFYHVIFIMSFLSCRCHHVVFITSFSSFRFHHGVVITSLSSRRCQHLVFIIPFLSSSKTLTLSFFFFSLLLLLFLPPSPSFSFFFSCPNSSFLFFYPRFNLLSSLFLHSEAAIHLSIQARSYRLS